MTNLHCLGILPWHSTEERMIDTTLKAVSLMRLKCLGWKPPCPAEVLMLNLREARRMS